MNVRTMVVVVDGEAKMPTGTNSFLSMVIGDHGKVGSSNVNA
jgi:hypothetical protein